MKYILLISSFIVLISCTQKKSEKSELQVSPVKSVTEITDISFEEEIHDFGNLKSGEILLYKFKFVNTGEHPLVIKEVNSDCGCIRAIFSKSPVNSGDGGFIEIEFNSTGLFGKQFKSIEIHANTQELKHLAIFAEVKNEQIEIKY